MFDSIASLTLGWYQWLSLLVSLRSFLDNLVALHHAICVPSSALSPTWYLSTGDQVTHNSKQEWLLSRHLEAMRRQTQLHIMTFRNDMGLGMLFWWECDVYNLARKWILGPRNVTWLISIYVAGTKPWVQSLTPYKSDIVACVHHPSTQEEDAGGSEMQGSFGAQDSLGSMRPGQKGWEMKKEKRRERKGRKEDQWENRMRYIPSYLKQGYSPPQEKQI